MTNRQLWAAWIAVALAVFAAVAVSDELAGSTGDIGRRLTETTVASGDN